jgi:ATP-dependent Clp protease protease subunit
MMGKSKFWAFRNLANEPSAGELTIYGEISDYSWWGDEVTPKQFRDELKELGDIDVLKVFINSPGGDVFAGQTIHSILKRHKARVEVYVDGIAASAASVIAMAGDVVRMPRNAMLMVHNAWTFGMGNAAEFRKLADDLDKISETIVAAYRDKTDLPDEDIKALLDAETWMTAEEAVEKGFADEIEESKQVAASIKGKILNINGQAVNLEQYRNPPKLRSVVDQNDLQRRKLAIELELL